MERYIVAAILPYMCLTLLLLTAMLLAQQANRFAELLGSTRAPLNLTLQLAFSLVPGILIFTVPMATLAGTMIGFSRMGSDSELVALSAAGIGGRQTLLPLLLLGIAATLLTLYCGLEIAPAAARSLRETTLRAALHKLDSPVELRTFNTEIPGKIIYVRDGDETLGQWGRVFIYSQEASGQVRLITSRSGRIDLSGDQSELVLSDAVSTTLPVPHVGKSSGEQIVTDRSSQLRVRLDTGRSQVLTRLRARKSELDEMSLSELEAHADSTTGKQQYEAATEIHRRIALSVSPLCFVLLGAGLGLRVRRGGRASGVLISLAALFIYYLVSLTGEQMARAGIVPPFIGAWLAITLTLGSSIILLAANDRSLFGIVKIWVRQATDGEQGVALNQKGSRTSFILGLLDRGLLRSLFVSFALALSALVGIFMVFTVLELGRFLTATQAKVVLVAHYLFFLLPLAGISLAPVSLLVAVLVTYALMARRSEAVAWWAAGQSLYRLALPGLLCAATVSTGMWLLQESLMPQANIRQDVLRAQLRGGVVKIVTPTGRQWLASSDMKRLYSYEYDDHENTLISLLIFDFDQEGTHLKRVLSATKGFLVQTKRINLQGARELLVTTENSIHARGSLPLTDIVLINESTEVFKPALNKPSQLSAKQLSSYITTLKQRGEHGLTTSSASVAYERKRSDPVMPFVMLCIGVPLALIYGRRNAITALVAAVGIMLLLWGVIGGFQQLGIYGLLPAYVAAWAPLVIFGAIGLYTLSRTAT
ncbi:MAG: LptF/LptG family permease [Pyrinomonadaceae bacterium]|nr:LptF/LptG family permease [Pyrinomonadaceae bacterium]